MAITKTDYKHNDAKIICKKCKKPYAIFTESNGKTSMKCLNCYKTVDINSPNCEREIENNEKKDINDCFYLNDYKQYEQVRIILKEIFVDIEFDNASDGIHGDRLAIKLKENLNVYRKKIFDTGLQLLSFNIGLFRVLQPQKYEILIKECLNNKEKQNV